VMMRIKAHLAHVVTMALARLRRHSALSTIRPFLTGWQVLLPLRWPVWANELGLTFEDVRCDPLQRRHFSSTKKKKKNGKDGVDLPLALLGGGGGTSHGTTPLARRGTQLLHPFLETSDSGLILPRRRNRRM
jgi:hypothetical protein